METAAEAMAARLIRAGTPGWCTSGNPLGIEGRRSRTLGGDISSARNRLANRSRSQPGRSSCRHERAVISSTVVAGAGDHAGLDGDISCRCLGLTCVVDLTSASRHDPPRQALWRIPYRIRTRSKANAAPECQGRSDQLIRCRVRSAPPR